MALTTQPPLICKENTSVQKFPKFDDQPQAMKDFLTYRHCKSFPQLIKSTMKCGGPNKSKDIFLLLAIKSSPGNYERREAIRKTWGAEEIYRNVQVRRLFLTGIPKSQQEEKRLNKLLEIESHTYGDILQWNFQDTFYNLTLKQIMFHQWVQTWCPDVQFIFNGDDDVFVNTFNVLAYLYSLGKNGRTNHLFVGQLNIGMPPVRESYSKYYVPEELFSGNLFLPYCGGGGIIMSGFTTQSIFKASKKIPLFPIDDAYLGMCLDQAGLKPDNHEGMKTYGISLSGSVDSFDPCYYQYMLMVHRFMPYEMLVMWNALQIKRFGCKRNTNSQKLNKQKQ
ncbi:N-acetyllactosaminide beta-1,3-N-acetylglucosaminyltransferase 3-like [Spea bombifrons]|uniref:N-acetyllactosaminide beta-1,3-N-acetylglucosaminyltransferase 3-like n=1 Tax=Spea bombifrons TaxID=233779 RepID=UPI00234A4156|nr:N-acetyllactosaminide beta-1,3-N-acetylglucosaminyltransferase 3-like [Spea bombifrons]